MRRTFLIFIALLMLFAACGRRGSSSSSTGGKSMQIKGSDTIVNLVQSWAEEFSTVNPDMNIGVTGGGSGTGIAALLNNTCDICMSSRGMEDKELAQAKKSNIVPNEIMVGLDGLAVVVHPSNTADKLTIDELRDIFMANKRNWKDFGGPDSEIVILSRESNSGTHVFFKEHVLKRGKSKGPEEFAPESLLMPSSQAIVDELRQNPNAIGYVGMGYISPALKVVSVAIDKKTKYIAPTVENVMSGKYPISRPLFLYTNGMPKGDAKLFVDFALSPRGQVIVKETDFVPIGTMGKMK